MYSVHMFPRDASTHSAGLEVEGYDKGSTVSLGHPSRTFNMVII